MNHQETPQLTCRCCELCIHTQNERPRRINCHEGREKYHTPHTPQNRKNENCSDGYYTFEKHSVGGQSLHHHSSCYDRKQWVDASTLKALSTLRERACKFLGASEGSVSQEEDECKPYLRVKESRPCEIPPKKKSEEIDYEPQSNFLRKMKLQSDVKIVGRDIRSPSVTYDSSCFLDRQQTRVMDDSQLSSKKFFRNQQSPQTNKVNVSEQSTQLCDMPQDTCTCYKTWRTNSSDLEQTGDFDLMKEYGELYRELSAFQDVLEGKMDKECREDVKGKHKRPSRSNTRKGRVGRRRRSRTGGKSHQGSESSFQPSLKKPHPNACDRCWRYASPSRSPVNKPSQRFDPNYRKSHSDIFVNLSSEMRGGRETSKSPRPKTTYSSQERETKIQHLVSSGSRLPSPMSRSIPLSGSQTGTTKSSEHLKKRVAGSAKDEEKGEWSNVDVKRTNLKGDGRSFSLNFEETFNKKAGAAFHLTPSPSGKRGSMSVRKETSCSRPSTSEKFSERDKSRAAVASQTSASIVNLGKVRAQSADRGQRTPSHENGLGRSKVGRSPTKCSPNKSQQMASSSLPPNSSSKNKSIHDSTKDGHQARPENTTSCLCKASVQREEGKCPCSRPNASSPSRRGKTSSTHHCSSCHLHQSNSLDRSSRGGNVQQEAKKCPCQNQRQERLTNIRRESPEEQNNPRKYCVFYMNKTQLNKADDIEILIEELTQGRGCKDSEEESLKGKMNKIKEVKGDSMALRFQKGVSHNCQRPESNRVLYF